MIGLYKLKESTAELVAYTGIGHAELGGRIAYDSVKGSAVSRDMSLEELKGVTNITLLHKLSWVYFHESVLEHIVMSYRVETTRGVLQELARHRIASYTVRSTRYTMQDLIYACYIVMQNAKNRKIDEEDVFMELLNIEDLNPYHINNEKYLEMKLGSLYNTLKHLMFHSPIDELFSKDAIEVYESYSDSYPQLELLRELRKCKSKKNVGDRFKALVVDDAWKTEMMFTINARSLKNFLKLRLPNSAWNPMRDLANKILLSTPDEVKDLIVKKKVEDEK